MTHVCESRQEIPLQSLEIPALGGSRAKHIVAFLLGGLEERLGHARDGLIDLGSQRIGRPRKVQKLLVRRL